MDISVAASMFDDQPVYDKYTDDLLFMGQPLNYDGSVRDSVASWRRSISATTIVTPPRGVVYFGAETFLTGRVTQDFFQGDVIRENLILHPCDDTYRAGPAADFLATSISAGLTPFYGGATWRKSSLDEKESPEFFSIVDLYFSRTEISPALDDLVLSSQGMLYRVRSLEDREGGFTVAVCSELGANVISDASYVPKGVYNAGTDSMLDGSTVSLKAIVEAKRTNFKFLVSSAAKYEPGDRIITVRKADVSLPAPEDSVSAAGVDYRVVSAQQDDNGGCWELHCRRV